MHLEWHSPHSSHRWLTKERLESCAFWGFRGGTLLGKYTRRHGEECHHCVVCSNEHFKIILNDHQVEKKNELWCIILMECWTVTKKKKAKTKQNKKHVLHVSIRENTKHPRWMNNRIAVNTRGMILAILNFTLLCIVHLNPHMLYEFESLEVWEYLEKDKFQRHKTGYYFWYSLYYYI